MRREMGFLSFVGAAALCWLAVMVYKFVSYPKRVTELLRKCAVVKLGAPYAAVIDTTLVVFRRDWDQLIERLRDDGLDIASAAIVGAAFVRDLVPTLGGEEVLRDDLKQLQIALQDAVQQKQVRAKGYIASLDDVSRLDAILTREGFEIVA